MTAPQQLCSHCLLPVGLRPMRRTLDGEDHAFCCYGCAIAFLVTGAEKAEMLAHVRSGAEDVPAGRLRSAGEAHWFVDRAAAGY